MNSSTQYKYICQSSTGQRIQGIGKTDHPMGSKEQTRDLLNFIAADARAACKPWDPFNLSLVVRAQAEPKPFSQMSAEQIIDFLAQLFHPNDQP